jgi:hypothetical protein
MLTFVLPAVWISAQPGFRIEHTWYLSVATNVLQAVTSLLLLRWQLRRRLPYDSARFQHQAVQRRDTP